MGSRDPSDQSPLTDTDEAFQEIDELSAEQCGYPVFSTLAVAELPSCSLDTAGIEQCIPPTDPRAEFEQFQRAANRVDTYFEAGGTDWIAELPGKQIASVEISPNKMHVLLRVTEDEVPEVGLWIAEFVEINEFDIDDGDLALLRSPLFWHQALHRANFLSLFVIGGIFGEYTYPENPQGLKLDVRSLSSPALDPARGDEAQDLYRIDSELPSTMSTEEEILPVYQSLAPDESLVLISIGIQP